MDHNLYKELYIKRRRLKFQNRTPEGKLPNICSDTALEDMAKYAPKKKEELLNISGLGQVFVDKYGDDFMQVLNVYHKSKQSFENLDSDVRQTLQFLEQRLVNISRKNRLLYLGKLSNSHSFDLFDDQTFNDNLMSMIYGKKKDLVLCSLSAKNPKLTTDQIKYKKLSTLHREVVKDFREHGDYGLYIGYPFVIGKSTTEDFLVKAPLCLFPAIIERTPKEIKLSIDKNKDILFKVGDGSCFEERIFFGESFKIRSPLKFLHTGGDHPEVGDDLLEKRPPAGGFRGQYKHLCGRFPRRCHQRSPPGSRNP